MSCCIEERQQSNHTIRIIFLRPLETPFGCVQHPFSSEGEGGRHRRGGDQDAGLKREHRREKAREVLIKKKKKKKKKRAHTSSAMVSVVCKVVKKKGKGYGNVEHWRERGAGYQSEKE